MRFKRSWKCTKQICLSLSLSLCLSLSLSVSLSLSLPLSLSLSLSLSLPPSVSLSLSLSLCLSLSLSVFLSLSLSLSLPLSRPLSLSLCLSLSLSLSLSVSEFPACLFTSQHNHPHLLPHLGVEIENIYTEARRGSLVTSDLKRVNAKKPKALQLSKRQNHKHAVENTNQLVRWLSLGH